MEIADIPPAGLMAVLLLVTALTVLSIWTGNEPGPAFIYSSSPATLADGALLVWYLTGMTGIAIYALALFLICRFHLT